VFFADGHPAFTGDEIASVKKQASLSPECEVLFAGGLIASFWDPKISDSAAINVNVMPDILSLRTGMNSRKIPARRFRRIMRLNTDANPMWAKPEFVADTFVEPRVAMATIATSGVASV
jgi:hypothetical protein